MLNLTHHLIVHFAATLAHKSTVTKYIILGDDIVICDDDIALYYKRIIARLGVDISEAKTHVSQSTYEFAKRWIHKGREVTGLPLRGIFQNIKNPIIVYTILLDHSMKGNIYLFNGTLSTLIMHLYLYLTGIGFKFKYKFTPKYFREVFSTYVFGLRYSVGLATDDEIRSILAQYTSQNPEFRLPNFKEGRSVILRVFKDSLESKAEKAMQSVSKSIGDAYKFMPNLDTLYLSPLFHAVLNRIEQIRTISDEFSRGAISLRSAIRGITFNDLEENLI